MSTAHTAPIPAFVNAHAGSASEALEVLRADPRFHLRETSVEELSGALAEAVEEGATKVLVAGGDGTLASAASVLAGRPVALAILPAGTLNHFARELGVPVEPDAALEAAVHGRPTPVDVGGVNGRVFLNTSAVGAYVVFVRTRERWERWLGYYGASVFASVSTFFRLRTFTVELEAEGEVRRYESPLVFVGVGERELRAPKLGGRKDGGLRGLHVLIVQRTSRLRLLAMALRTALKGARPWAGEAELESLIVQRCVITPPRRFGRVAVDGEIVPLEGPLAYRFEAGALTVVTPPPG